MEFDPGMAAVYLSMRFDKQHLALGSGVLYRSSNAVYIVTAWHNVTGRHSSTFKPLHSDCAIPNNVVAWIACDGWADGEYTGWTRMAFTIPLEDSHETHYLVHEQQWPRVDVAVIPIDLDRIYKSEYSDILGNEITLEHAIRSRRTGLSEISTNVRCVQDFEVAAQSLTLAQRLSVADELFVLGYPKGITDQTGQPIWKRASVATSPRLKWQNQDKFLVDCASREGMSGAPAISYFPKGKVEFGPRTIYLGSPAAILQGIYVSRVGSDELGFEAHVGTIWRTSVIQEIIDAKIPGIHSSKLASTKAEVLTAIESKWPREGKDYGEKLLSSGTLMNYFTNIVMNEIAGREGISFVTKQIREYALSKVKATDP